MGAWIIRWNFNKDSYSPGEQAIASFWLENTGDSYLHMSRLKLEFDFGTYDLDTISGMIAPRKTSYLGNVALVLPEGIVGRKVFHFTYHMYEYVYNQWTDLGFYETDRQFFISIYPLPFYTVFVSRGLQLEDRAIGDPIAEMIREWGFQTITIGVEIQVPEEQVPSAVREAIRTADGVVAIATPRFLDALAGLWRTLEWLHGEVGIGFGTDKPLLILGDSRASLGGLPSYLAASRQAPFAEFDAYNLDDLRVRLSAVMPGFRGWIETKRKRAFFEGLGRILAVVGGIVVVSGIAGAIKDSSKK